MAFIPTHPGVYVEELASGARSVAALPTSITAFVGRALRGPTDIYDFQDQVPTVIDSYTDYERIFGGLWTDSAMSYAVRDFFRNGGSQALIVRLYQAAAQSVARIVVPTTKHDAGGAATGAGSDIVLISSTPGAWGNRLRVTIDHDPRSPANDEAPTTLFNLKIELIPENDVGFLQQLPDLGTRVEEIHLNVTCAAGLPNSVDFVLYNNSMLMRVDGVLPGAQPVSGVFSVSLEGDDGAVLIAENFIGNEAMRTGVHALLKSDLFNMLCIPP